MRRSSFLTAVTLLTVAGAAHAHPKLLSAVPAANSAVVSPARVELHFSEKLMPQFSKGDLMMAMKGMAPMKMASTASVASDGRTLVLTPKSPLTGGSYNLAWRVVSTDTHRVAGNYSFKVK